MSTQVTIIGGSGFVGRAIIRQALNAGHRIVVACKHPERARDLQVSGVQLVKADVTTGSGLDEVVSGSSCVINLVGLLFERGRYTFEAAHVGGTENILAACQRAGVGQYLHMSALGAGKVPESAYARTKAEAESRVRDSGLQWTIFRPSIIYGAGDSFFNRFKTLSSIGPILPVVAGETRFQPVWVEDVARAFVLSIGNRKVAGNIYELAGPAQYSFIELMKMLMKTLDRDRLLIPVPDFAATVMAAAGQLLPVPPLTLDQLRMLKHDNVVEGEPFPELFGTASHLESILPAFIRSHQEVRLQDHLDESRTRYRQLR